MEHLKKATEVHPELAEAWQILAEAYLTEADETRTPIAFRNALAADPAYALPHAYRGKPEQRANLIEESAKLTGKAIELDPYLSSVDYCHAIA